MTHFCGGQSEDNLQGNKVFPHTSLFVQHDGVDANLNRTFTMTHGTECRRNIRPRVLLIGAEDRRWGGVLPVLNRKNLSN